MSQSPLLLNIMNVSSVKLPLNFRLRMLYFVPERHRARTCNIGKRGSMLNKFLANNDNKKHWHLTFMEKPQKNVNIFDKIHRPAKRVTVLNSLFIRNITDLLSTSDIATDIMGYGIEITEVKVTSDYHTVNVYWQVPLNKLDLYPDIQAIFDAKAPKIRAELISRNIMGKVPRIFFIQDPTNIRAAEFEKALRSADMGPETDEVFIPDHNFLKNILRFTTAQEAKNILLGITTAEPEEVKKKDVSVAPDNPSDMRTDILGLDHGKLMTKVVIAKKTMKLEGTPSVVERTEESNDLFSQIPGTILQSNENREKILRQFYMDRKLQIKEQRRSFKYTNEDDVELRSSEETFCNEDEVSNYEPDYFEENLQREENF